MNPLMPLLFLLSGATALVYEVVWSKYLALVFGSTIQAQTIVLAVFMGGLALGNFLFGRKADRIASPVRVYGIIELSIGIYAAAFHWFYGIADGLFVRLGSVYLESGLLLLTLKAALSLGLLLVPTVLMGGTLPLISAWLQQRSKQAGRGSALFYGLNSLGAVIGAGVAGFLLVRRFGLPNTLLIAAATNAAIGLLAIVFSRKLEAVAPKKPVTKKEKKVTEAASGITEEEAPTPFAVCALVFLTGAVSMGLEIVASRSLSMIFGASLQAFAVVLIAFILGISIGGMVIASVRKPKWIHAKTVVLLLLVASGFIALFLLTVEQWAVYYLRVRNGFVDDKFFYHQLLSGGISIVVLGLPAALIGAVLPLCIRILSASSTTLGRDVGRLLTWNTIGAVVGVMFTGFVLMPTVGVRLSFGILAFLLTVAALMIAIHHNSKIGIGFSVACAAAVLTVSTTNRENWQYALGSGIFRERGKEIRSDHFTKLRQQDKLLFYKDGSDATVSVVTDRGQAKISDTVLCINGKPDGSAVGDLATQYLLAHLPMMMRPASTDVFVLGFGTGITAGALLGHPVKSITVAENCAPVLEAAKFFNEWNKGVHNNTVTKIYREDGRTVLKLRPQTYDIIISEPSNPWTAGIGSVFSHEFYEIAANRLKPGGMMAQWFHLYETSDDIVRMVLRTFESVFPHVEVWETRHGDLVLLGSKAEWTCSTENLREVFDRPQPRQDLNRIGFRTAEAIWARQVASQNTSFAIAGSGVMQSDFAPILEYDAPRAFYEQQSALEIFLCDERMLQGAFAPEEKQKALASISNENLHKVFSDYGSANSPLMQYVNWRAQMGLFAKAQDVYPPEPYLEFIFRAPESYPKAIDLPKNATGEMRQFVEAQGLLHQTNEWRRGVQRIEALLLNYDPDRYEEGKLNPRPGLFAAAAIRVCLAHGEHETAKKLITKALEIEPEDVQLRFLSNLLEHQRKPARLARQ